MKRWFIMGTPAGGPGRVEYAGLVQSIATREPNFEPRRETMCLLQISQQGFACKNDRDHDVVEGLPNMVADQLTMVRTGVDEDVLNNVVAELVTSDCACQQEASPFRKSDLLSMSGMRGRSARPSQTRSR